MFGPPLERGSGARTYLPDGASLLWLVVVGVVLPYVVSAFAGTTELPRNDDWSYRRIAFAWWETGRLELDGAAWTMLLGQLVLTMPLLWFMDGAAGGIVVAGLIFATAGMVGAYAMARQLLPPARAVVAATLLAAFPGYLGYATSFMNDVPAVAAQFAALGLAIAAVRRQRTSLFVAALVVACFAFSVRHFGLAAVAAVLLVYVASRPRHAGTWLVALATVLACTGLLVYRASLPGQLSEAVPDFAAAAPRLPHALFTLSLALAPASALAIATWSSGWRVRHVLVGCALAGVVVAVAGAQYIQGPRDVLLDNLTTQSGLTVGYLAGWRPVLIPDALWSVLNAGALGALVLLAAPVSGRIATRAAGSVGGANLLGALRRPEGVLLAYVGVMAIGMMGFGLAFPIFDRYLWPLVPPIATLLLLPVGDSSAARSSTSRAWERLGIAALLSLLAFAVVLTMNSHAWDAARWRAGEALVRAGLRPEQIDAGYEWMGYHAAAPARPARQPGRTWYASWWPDAVICGVATSGGFRLPDSVYIGRVRYRLLLIAGPTHDIQLYRIQTRGCD